MSSLTIKRKYMHHSVGWWAIVFEFGYHPRKKKKKKKSRN